MRLSIISCLTLLSIISRAAAEDIGEFRNDWTGNGIVVEAIADPKVQGVTCHISRFSRSVIDRLAKGGWFVDPSNSSTACRQTGPVTIGDINTSASGEEVFSEAQPDLRVARGAPHLRQEEHDVDLRHLQPAREGCERQDEHRDGSALRP